MSNTGFSAMMTFLLILTLGLYYEWNLGALRWKNYAL
jgi:NADH:ubiquinone oxidoreductase subunit 3 (subunit A)